MKSASEWVDVFEVNYRNISKNGRMPADCFISWAFWARAREAHWAPTILEALEHLEKIGHYAPGAATAKTQYIAMMSDWPGPGIKQKKKEV